MRMAEGAHPELLNKGGQPTRPNASKSVIPLKANNIKALKVLVPRDSNSDRNPDVPERPEGG